ncbi:cell wall-binding repeat-containing protein [Herbiconiux sp. 11R-BC]|uniref:cell wall-binding repeat-containing protein n=1 Tax=Herbiconiux sp. 11R-BC TaxID=3111637 RepID=UPI003C0598AC
MKFSQDSSSTPTRFGVTFAGSDDPSTARTFDVGRDSVLSGVDAVLPPYAVAVASRLTGADRFDVSVEASQAGFAPGVDQVYVANGLNWPDALSAGPAAAYHHAPLLLVTPGSLPAAVRTEIQRLDPREIVIVGGRNSVGDDVLHQLQPLAQTTTRIDGADRYAVSRALDLAAFGTPLEAKSLLVASGRNFPDALSSGAVAAAWRAPVVLVDGLAQQLDADTRSYIFSTGISGSAVGGPASITDNLVNDLGSFNKYDGPGSRIGGEDRFAVNRNLNTLNGYFAPPTLTSTAYLVSGLNFPDALSATTLAAQERSRVFLAAPDCVPQATLDTMRGLHVTKIVLVGGPNTLGAGVAALKPC